MHTRISIAISSAAELYVSAYHQRNASESLELTHRRLREHLAQLKYGAITVAHLVWCLLTQAPVDAF
eukprot:COSAG02_NODE_353_length_24023_cov_77.872304_9_plen_67_part_00